MVGVRVEPLAGEEEGAEPEGRGCAGSSPRGSSRLMARKAVGAVKSASTPCSRDHPPEGARVRGAHRLALVEDRRAAVDQRARRRCRSGRPPSRCPTPPRTPRPAPTSKMFCIDQRERHRVAAVVAHDTLRLPGGAGGVEDVERVGGAPPARSPAGSAPAIRLVPVEVAPGDEAARCASGAAGSRTWRGLCLGDARARDRGAACTRSTRWSSIPHEADTTTLGRASSMRIASSWAAKPPKTTEWTAPSRAQASIATRASGTIGM